MRTFPRRTRQRRPGTQGVVSLLMPVCVLSLVVACSDSGPSTDVDAARSDAAALDARSPDAMSVAPDGGFVLGEPLNVPDNGDAFTLFRSETFPGVQCMDGSEAGISVRLNPGATGLVVNFQGGGLCVDPGTCAGVRNRNGFSADDANGHIVTEAAAIMNANDAANPARDFHHVFVHYCSGDLHAGNNPNGFDGTVNRGRANTEEFLARIAPTFNQGESEVSVVLLSGSSAGGMATLLNYPLVQEAFGAIPVHAFIDAPPPAENTLFRSCQQQYWEDSLLVGNLAPGCASCSLADGGLESVLSHLLDTYPNRRFGWFSGTEDAVLRCLGGETGGTCTPTNVSGADFQAGLVAMRTRLASKPNFKTYFYPSNLHTAMFFPTTSFTRLDIKGVQLGDWIGDLIAGNASWDHVRGETEPTQNNIVFPCGGE